MATITYTGTVSTTETFLSTDDVTFTGATTVTGSITKNDALAMDSLKIVPGVRVSITTGHIDIKGTRDAWVHVRSNVSIASRVHGGDWFEFTGTSTSNTMKWCVFHGMKYGLRFNGHAPATGKFQYLVFSRNSSRSCYFVGTTTGGVLDDFYFVDSVGADLTGTSTWTWNNFVMVRPSAVGAGAMGGNMTLNSFAILESHWANNTMWIASGITITLNDFYWRDTYGGATAHRPWSGDGDTVITGMVKRGGGHGWYHNGAGDLTISDADMYGGHVGNGGVGLWLAGTGNIILDNVAMTEFAFGAPGNFDTSTSVPSGNTPAMYTDAGSGAFTITNPRSTKYEDNSVNTLSANVATAGEVTFTATSTSLAKMKILMTKTSGDYSTGAVTASEYDAPDIMIPGLDQPLVCLFSDFGESGKTYVKGAHSIKIDNLMSGDYYWKAVCENAMGEPFESDEQGPITVTSAEAAGGGSIAQLHRAFID